MTETATMDRLRTGPHVATDLLPRLLPRHAAGAAGSDVTADLAAHVRRHGLLPKRFAGPALIDEIRAAGLTGRGGAAFAVAAKMAAVTQQGRRPVVVGNGAEGEPASSKDRQLLRFAPHLVLDGLQCAAQAVGATRAYLYVQRDGQLLRKLDEAIAERGAARLDRVPVELVDAPPRFLAGEESALASHLNGGLALPAFKARRVFERGVGGAPTLVHNVETLAHVALVARHGAAWFRAAGTAAEPGTMLVTCHHADGTVRVGEIEIGASLAGVLRLTQPGAPPVQAVLAGGYHGAWLPVERAVTLPLANAALRTAGTALGAGVLAALPASRCGLAETAMVVRYLAAESAGQCGPCLNGLPRIAVALTELSGQHPDRRCLPELQRWTGLMPGRGACHHPDGTVRLVRSALRVFSGEVGLHLRGTCQAARDGHQPAFLPVPATAPASRESWR